MKYKTKDDRCPYHRENWGLACEKKNNCVVCGWNPEVEAERKMWLQRDINALRRMTPAELGLPVFELEGVT